MEQSSVNIRDHLSVAVKQREKISSRAGVIELRCPFETLFASGGLLYYTREGHRSSGRNFGLTTCSTTLRRLVDRLLQRNSDAGMMSKCDGAD